MFSNAFLTWCQGTLTWNMPALMPQSSRFTVPLSGIAGNPLPGNGTGRKKGEAGPSRRWRGVSLPQENQAIGKSKGGMTTKILALTDALGNLVRFELLPGNRFDTVGVAPLIKGITFGALPPCVREVVRCSIFPLFLRWAE